MVSSHKRSEPLFSQFLIVIMDMYAKKHKVHFDDDGVPYVTVAQKTIDCHHRVDRQVNAKQKRKELKLNERYETLKTKV